MNESRTSQTQLSWIEWASERHRKFKKPETFEFHRRWRYQMQCRICHQRFSLSLSAVPLFRLSVCRYWFGRPCISEWVSGWSVCMCACVCILFLLFFWHNRALFMITTEKRKSDRSENWRQTQPKNTLTLSFSYTLTQSIHEKGDVNCISLQLKKEERRRRPQRQQWRESIWVRVDDEVRWM